MKKTLTMVALCLLPAFSLSQPSQNSVFKLQKEVVCMSLDVLIRAITEEYKENPIFIAVDESKRSKYVLTIGPQKSWTMIQYTEDVGCIIGHGSDAMYAPAEKSGNSDRKI
jgi:hypothetical protein